MAWVRNDSERDLRGPDGYIMAPGEVREVPDKWLSARNDRVRRGYLTIVSEPEVIDLSEFVEVSDEEE